MTPPPASDLVIVRRSEWLFSFGLLMIAFVLILVGRTYAPGALQRWFVPVQCQTPVEILLLPVAAVMAMITHEAGHLLASLGLGFQIMGGSLGPLQFQILHGTWKLSFSRRNFFKASISAIPRGLNHWRAAIMIVVAAGPLATLGAAVLAAKLQAGNHLYASFQMEFVQVSLLLFLLGLIPTGAQARTPNDARLLLDLLCQNQGAEEMELFVLLSQQVLLGARPEDYPRTLIARLAAWRGRPESQLSFAQALVRWALDSEEVQLADDWDARALTLSDQCNHRLQNNAFASSACFDVLFREDSESALNKFARVDFDALFPKCFEQRARACQQFALGRLHRVPHFIIRAQYAIPRGIPAYNLERFWLDRLHMKVLVSTGVRQQKYRTASV